ncbi:MAG: hypothetical protein V4509_01810 [Patescibacteria group bacterium]
MTNLPRAIIIEIDGCLADNSHRLHFVDPIKAGCIPGMTDILDKREPFSKYCVNPVTREKFKPDYEAFYNAISDDKVNEWCLELLHGMHESYCDTGSEGERDYNEDFHFLFITERPNRFRHKTLRWLRTVLAEDIGRFNTEIVKNWTGKLFMRPDTIRIREEYSTGLHRVVGSKNIPDNRPAHEVKREIYMNEIAGKYEILFAIDSDERVCEMWKSLGITTLQVK